MQAEILQSRRSITLVRLLVGSTGITVRASTGTLTLNDNLTTSDGDDAGSIAATATAGAITDGSAIMIDSMIMLF